MKKLVKKIFVITMLLMSINHLSADSKKEDLYGWWVVDGKFVKAMISDMEKDMEEQDKKMFKMFLPMVERMMKKMTLVINDKEIRNVYGDRDRVKPYKVIKIEGNKFVLESGGRETSFILKDGRLVEERSLKKKGPPMYLRKLNADEIEKRKKLIADAKKPPAADAKPDTRLNFLVYRAAPEQIEKLLKEQPDLLTIKRSFDGSTALAMAIDSGKLELIKTLIDAGAKVDVVNKRGENLLFACVKNFKPNKEIFELLVKKGVDPKALNISKENLLIVYCERGKDPEFLKYLLTLGLDVNQKASFDRTAMSNAMENEWQEGVDILMKNGAKSSNLKASMDKLVRKQNLKALKSLADKGIMKDDDGMTPIMHALSYGKVNPKANEIIEMFKKVVNEKDSMGQTALFYTKDLKTIKNLVKAGADVKAKDRSGDSVLHYNCDAPTEVLKYYIEEHKLDVNAKNERKQTPLQHACARKDNIENIKYLIEKKADLNNLDKFGSSPLSWSMVGGHNNSMEYIKLLIEKGADPNKDYLEIIKECCFKGKKDELKFLVSKGLSLKTDPKEHYTPFRYAISVKKPEMVKLLIELGADPNVKNAAGKTALDMAKDFKAQKCIEVLKK